MPDIYGTSWGATPRTLGDAGGVVTWSIVGAGYNIATAFGGTGSSVDSSTLGFDVAGSISAAFAAWSRHGNIEFMQIEDAGGDPGSRDVADIRIFFGNIPGGTIGMAYFPSGYGSDIAGDMLLDSGAGNNWAGNVLEFYSLVLHELGHSLGLGHVGQYTTSIMTPFLSQNSLQQDDINGIKTIYGAQDNAPAVYNMPSGETNLNILEAPTAPGLTVNGNSRNNTIDGTDADETLHGKAGNDTLIGRRGNDTVTGGAGADDFIFVKGDDTLIITDFKPGMDDLVFQNLPDGFSVKNLLPFVSQDGADVVIAAGSQEVRFENTQLSELSASDVAFV